ncbi:MAG TPA: RNA-binding cell elongation regulator Jag/EloR [Acidimicrobiia bacterium]|nr:RNA-binding cell elongation regulator Jag/EloR [Acidimicrobiia bacterium]
MEWVETTGKTVADALDAALDTLGVDEDEVEYEVLREGRGGFLGRRDARVRARVRPISREKPGERQRRSRRGREGSGGGGRPARAPSTGGGGNGGRSRGGGGQRPRPRKRPAGDRAPQTRGESRTKKESRMEETVSEVSVEEQAHEAETFTRGLVEAFGAPAQVATIIDDEGGVLVDVTGSDLGLLVGPRGATLQAIEELVRTVVQRRTEGHGTRINVDVAGYRARRREALAQFAEELATKVRDSGKEQALEPMPPADRKVVHDTIADLEGVTTVSEGEEPRRRVVVRPA